MADVRYLKNFGSCKALDTAGIFLSQYRGGIFLMNAFSRTNLLLSQEFLNARPYDR